MKDIRISADQYNFTESSDRLRTVGINRQYINNTKLCRILATKQIDINNDMFELRITEKIVNVVKIWRDDSISTKPEYITPFDIALMDATYTIMIHGPTVITPEWIVRVMSGNSRVQVTEKKINRVKDSIIKLQNVNIKIDCTAEYNAFQIKKGDKAVEYWGYESYLLPFDKVEARYEVNGKMAVAYKIRDKPALFRYAELNRQIVSVPAYLLDTKGFFSDTEEAVIIKRAVIKRVGQIVKRNSLCNNKIAFLWKDSSNNEVRGLFPELGYVPDSSNAWRKKKSRIIKIVKGTLDILVKGNAITYYEAYREDGTNNPASPISGYKVFYDARQTSLTVK